MLSKFKNGFKLIGLNGETSSGGHGGGDKGGSEAAVGLGILVQISQGNKSKIIVKSALRFSQPTICSSLEFSCFLKTCHLCNKGLSLDKEVYMYRGDLGFCSIECRNRQIVIDDMKELEASTKQMIASYRLGLNRCTNTTSANSRRDYSHKNVLEDVHLQHEQIPHQGKIIFAI